jgi:hypothetical protein
MEGSVPGSGFRVGLSPHVLLNRVQFRVQGSGSEERGAAVWGAEEDLTAENAKNEYDV